MIAELINSKDFKTTKWSGGETTEIFIYPQNGDYSKRDFNIRISSALIEDEKSAFTKLDNVKRWIMPLKGNMELTHNKTRTVILEPYNIDSFSGNDETICKGKGIDFNLMIKGNYSGKIFTLNLNKDINIIALQEAKFYIFYAYNYNFKYNDFNINVDNALVLNDIDRNENIIIKGKGIIIGVKIGENL